MDKAEKKRLCSGCHNDFYNTSVGECWMLDRATPVDRTQVGIWQNPPYKWRPQQTLSCHHPSGRCWIDRDDCRLVENGAK